VKAAREAKEGAIAQYIAPDGKVAVLVEVNSRRILSRAMKFFRAFADDVANGCDRRESLILNERQRCRENPREYQESRRHAKMEVSRQRHDRRLQSTPARKSACWWKSGAGKAETVARTSSSNSCATSRWQIAAGHPHAVFARSRSRRRSSRRNAESRRVIRPPQRQAAQAMEKILAGVLDKFFQTYCPWIRFR